MTILLLTAAAVAAVAGVRATVSLTRHRRTAATRRLAVVAHGLSSALGAAVATATATEDREQTLIRTLELWSDGFTPPGEPVTDTAAVQLTDPVLAPHAHLLPLRRWLEASVCVTAAPDPTAATVALLTDATHDTATLAVATGRVPETVRVALDLSAAAAGPVDGVAVVTVPATLAAALDHARLPRDHQPLRTSYEPVPDRLSPDDLATAATLWRDAPAGGTHGRLTAAAAAARQLTALDGR